MFKVIQTAWAPNVQKDDLFLIFSLFFRVWDWFGDKYVKRLEKKLSEYIGTEVVSFDSGRSSLFALLEVFGIGKGDEVLLQAFTCVALPNPILWVGAKPVYVDVDLENYNLDFEDLKKKITPKTKAVVVQYTFGLAPNISELKRICEENNLLLIEDCCHNLGQKVNLYEDFSDPHNLTDRKLAGTIGDMAIYSFGMEKIISGTRGGVAVINPQVDGYNEKLKKLINFQRNTQKPRHREILRGLFNPFIWKSKEYLGAYGKLIEKFMMAIKMHEIGLTKLELIGKKASHLPYQLPNTNARMILNQFEKLEKFNEHRKKITMKYMEKFEDLKEIRCLNNEAVNEDIEGKIYMLKPEMGGFGERSWLRFPIVVNNPEKVLIEGRKKGIHLGNWYTEVIHCEGVGLGDLCYLENSCPKADWLSNHTMNLPTHQGIGKKEVDIILDFLKSGVLNS